MALSNAERQARYRAKRRALGLKQVLGWVDPAAPSAAARKEAWAQEIQDEKVKAARKAGREAERRKYYARGRTGALVDVCNHFIRKGRGDIAAALLTAFYVDRQTCEENAVDGMAMAVLEKGRVFDADGKPVKAPFAL